MSFTRHMEVIGMTHGGPSEDTLTSFEDICRPFVQYLYVICTASDVRWTEEENKRQADKGRGTHPVSFFCLPLSVFASLCLCYYVLAFLFLSLPVGLSACWLVCLRGVGWWRGKRRSESGCPAAATLRAEQDGTTMALGGIISQKVPQHSM